MAHLIGMSTHVGMLTLKDPRAKIARVELNGLDVTRGFGPLKYKILAAHDIEGWIHYRTPEGLTAFERGKVRITFEPCDEARALHEGTTIPSAGPDKPQ